MAGLESARLTIGNWGTWCARLDSNQHSTRFERVASTGWTTGALVGSVGFEPTLARSERVASAELGYEPVVFGARFELATMWFSTARVYQLRHPNIGGQSRI